jgi:hypothetical protein
MTLHTIESLADKQLAELEVIKRAFDTMIGMAPAVGAYRFAMYEAHLIAGFSAEQSLMLCMQPHR